jgi:hypothetical protein
MANTKEQKRRSTEGIRSIVRATREEQGTPIEEFVRWRSEENDDTRNDAFRAR